MSQHFLVTGGTGFIGASLVRRLVADGHYVRVLDNHSRGALRRLGDARSAVDLVEADIRDAAAVAAALESIQCVIHLAYVNGTELFYTQPELVLDVAVRGMLNVLDGCRSQGVRELVLASSSEVYQTPALIPTPEDVPLTVPDVLNPRYSYGGGKIACELLAINNGRRNFDRVLIFRPHNVYGPDMGWEHVLPQLICRAADAIEETAVDPVPFPIQGDGSQTRAFTHIDDCTEAIVRIIEKGETGGIYHVGNPEEVTIRDVTERIFRYMQREPEITAGELPPGATRRRCPDISRLRALGFSPRVPLHRGLPSIIDWYVANRHQRPARALAHA